MRNFLGVTFLKQALYELTADPPVLQQPATDENFAAVTAPLWAWYDALRPLLWRGGREFPENGPAARQLLNDGEIDITLSFNPAEAAVVDRHAACCPRARASAVLEKGTIGNTSFVAIPYNAAHKEAAMVVADFLLEPEAQARAQDIDFLGNFTVLDLERLPAADKQALRRPAPEPGAADQRRARHGPARAARLWMTRIIAEWEKRYVR